MTTKLKYILLSTVIDNNPLVLEQIMATVKSESTVVYVRGKSPSSNILFENVLSFYKQFGITNIEYFDLDQSNNKQLINALEHSDIVHLGGGNTFEFSKRMIVGDYAKSFIQLIPSKILVIGESAGGIILTDNLDIAKLLDDDNTKYPTSGLGLLNLSFLPHVNEISEEEFSQLRMNNSKDQFIYGCSDGGAVLIYENNNIELIDAMIIE